MITIIASRNDLTFSGHLPPFSYDCAHKWTDNKLACVSVGISRCNCLVLVCVRVCAAGWGVHHCSSYPHTYIYSCKFVCIFVQSILLYTDIRFDNYTHITSNRLIHTPNTHTIYMFCTPPIFATAQLFQKQQLWFFWAIHTHGETIYDFVCVCVMLRG